MRKINMPLSQTINQLEQSVFVSTVIFLRNRKAALNSFLFIFFETVILNMLSTQLILKSFLDKTSNEPYPRLIIAGSNSSCVFLVPIFENNFNSLS